MRILKGMKRLLAVLVVLGVALLSGLFLALRRNGNGGFGTAEAAKPPGPAPKKEPPAPVRLNDEELGKRVAELLPKLAVDDFEVREKATRDLVLLGPRVIPLLEPHVEDEDAEVRSRVRQVLGKLGVAKYAEKEVDRRETEQGQPVPRNMLE